MSDLPFAPDDKGRSVIPAQAGIQPRVPLRSQPRAEGCLEFDTWTKLLESATPEQCQAIAKTLNHWRNVDTDLPEPERAAWRTLWALVDLLLAASQS